MPDNILPERKRVRLLKVRYMRTLLGARVLTTSLFVVEVGTVVPAVASELRQDAVTTPTPELLTRTSCSDNNNKTTRVSVYFRLL